jgi:hypothetical protein
VEAAVISSLRPAPPAFPQTIDDLLRGTSPGRVEPRRADFSNAQYLQVLALTLDFASDLVIEVGRGYGNTTCVTTEAASRLDARVVGPAQERDAVGPCPLPGQLAEPAQLSAALVMPLTGPMPRAT